MNNFFRILGFLTILEGYRVFTEQEYVIGPSTVLFVIGISFILLSSK